MFAHETITIGKAVVVCGFSLAVVFLVLLTISYMIDLVHWVLTRNEKKPGAPVPAAAPAPVSAAPAAPVKDATGDAVLIAAAIAAYLGTTTDRIIVRSIRRVAGDETPWVQSSRTNTIQ